MTRIKSLFAALLMAATIALVPAANAQTVHFVGVGSSAMFQGFSVVAFNDFATTLPGSAKHWSCKTASGLAKLKDTRTPPGGSPPPLEAGNFWVVWNENAGVVTDIWAYLSVDSVVGVRSFLAAPKALLLLDPASKTTAGANAISSALFAGGQADEAAGIPVGVYNLLSGALGQPVQTGMTDIRPEDARLSTYRMLGAPFDTKPANPPLFYSFALGYGPAPISTNPIRSGIPGSSATATPVVFQLPGFNDPITSQPVPSTTRVIPIGEAPIIFIVNRSNTATGLGQTIGNQPAIGYTSDGSYYVRNVWTQHPWPATSQYPSLDFPSSGFCSIPANQALAQCHVTRRPVGNFFGGGDCEGDNSAFTWPLDSRTQGLRAVVPNGVVFPVNLYLREGLGGTTNTTEFTVFKRYGTVNGSNGVAAPFEKPPYISQETNIDPVANNPLNTQCPAKFGETAAQALANEGKRIRGVGTGEVVSGVQNNADSITYTFFSFANVSNLATFNNGGVKTNRPAYGYLMMDGIDPLFDNYENKITGSVHVEGEPLGDTNAGVTTNPGQPADPTNPLTWGLLPGCSEAAGSPLPTCRVSSIYGTNPSFPHIRDGSYPAWSELRAICDSAAAHCDAADDSLGTEAMIRQFQKDIHNNALGGSPDVLPFSLDNSFGPGNFQGDVGFVRQHFVYEQANDANEAGNVGANTNPTHNANLNRTSVHQANTLIDFHSEPCSGGAAPGTPKTSPLLSECGGDVGGFVVPFGSVLTGNQQ